MGILSRRLMLRGSGYKGSGDTGAVVSGGETGAIGSRERGYVRKKLELLVRKKLDMLFRRLPMRMQQIRTWMEMWIMGMLPL